MMATIKLSHMINPHFYPMWNTDKPYVICKGGRGSFKSSVISMRLVTKVKHWTMLGHKVNVVCVRENASYLHDSVYSQIRWALNMLHMDDEYHFYKSPLRITHKRTGSTFYFYGADDPMKLKSNIVDSVIAVWFEEAANFKGPDVFDQATPTFVRQKPDYVDHVTVYYSYNPPKNPYETLGKIISTIFSGIGDAFKPNGDAIGAITKPLRESSGFAKPLNSALKEIASHKTTLKAVGAAIGSIAAGFIAMKSVSSTISGIKLAVSALGRLKTAISGLSLLSNPVGIIVLSIVALGTAFVTAYKHSKTFRDGVNSVIKAISKTVGNVLKTVTKAFGGLWKSIKPSVDQIIKGFRDLFKTISPILKFIGIVWTTIWKANFVVVSTVFAMITKLVIAGLKAVWTNVKTYAKIIVDIWKLEWDIFKNAVIIVFKALATVVKTGVKVIKDVIDLVMNIITGNWKGAWNDIKDIFSSIWKGISKIGKDLFGSVRDMIKDVLGDIKGIWEDLWNGMAKFFSNIWDGIKDAAKAGLNGVIGFINTGVDGLNSVIHFFGGKKETITPIKKLAHGTSANDRDELALVNDEGGDTYQEAIVRANGKVEIPKNRNQLVFLNRGDEVIPAKKTAEMFGLSHYAKGKKGWLSAAWDNVKDWAGDTFEAIEDALKDPLSVLTGLFHKGKNTATAVWHDVGEGAANYLPKVGADWFKKELQKLEDALTPSNPSGSGAQRWKPYIEKAFKELHVNASEAKINKLLRQIQTESGGNPTIRQQISDKNSRSGNPAQGLLQFIPSTFNHWALKGHGQILNGYDQILAAINALEHGGEGGWGNVGNGHGWANGGWADRPSIFGEVKGQKEIAINPARPTSERHILEAIRARAAKSPSGFAAKLNQIITRQQMASHQIQPATPSANEVPTLGNGGRLNGNLTMNFVVDGTTMARVTYPKYKALMAHEITIRGAGGAVPVGQAIPVGGGF
ncbi:putative tape measure protein [Lactobacillus phage phiPYB5]|uniref:tail length tape measure protein n=1 Tax=Lactobacillus phage phiPYB5 TaxID=438780 RepID=UPI0001C0AD85|nr:tail length tape measure protein [Lactobacillus phage phiPYB5]ADA79893.1 putative tape measure protein [Lactobacillus phage phiPYB5]